MESLAWTPSLPALSEINEPVLQSEQMFPPPPGQASASDSEDPAKETLSEHESSPELVDDSPVSEKVKRNLRKTN